MAASGRSRDELVAEMPPRFGRATGEKIAVNAVMAGAQPGVSSMSMSTFRGAGRYTSCIAGDGEASP